ncbi:hypothetical protein J3R83DRAFT_10554 [Lanmaoa asiatica]|nr:hypothetical protein J3R83DRAFT_10554 [Lanmaoa asiatica]
MADTPNNPERRSVSRGRDAFQSSGRGGLGNIRLSSQSRDSRPTTNDLDDISHTRGREPAIHPDRVGLSSLHIPSPNLLTLDDQVISVGRGGAGNIRSPSRDAKHITEDAAEADYQARLVREHAEETTIHSSGRGGVGNISGSRSRSRDPAAVMHSTGRGGAGNIHTGNDLQPEALDAEERRQHAHPEGIHSTGRGGAANITVAHGPDIERVKHHLGEFESTGRGGAGNIRSRSASRDTGARAPSKEKHGVAAILDKFSHHQHLHTRTPDQPGAIASPNEGAGDSAH